MALHRRILANSVGKMQPVDPALASAPGATPASRARRLAPMSIAVGAILVGAAGYAEISQALVADATGTTGQIATWTVLLGAVGCLMLTYGGIAIQRRIAGAIATAFGLTGLITMLAVGIGVLVT